MANNDQRFSELTTVSTIAASAVIPILDGVNNRGIIYNNFAKKRWARITSQTLSSPIVGDFFDWSNSYNGDGFVAPVSTIIAFPAGAWGYTLEAVNIAMTANTGNLNIIVESDSSVNQGFNGAWRPVTFTTDITPGGPANGVIKSASPINIRAKINQVASMSNVGALRFVTWEL